MIGERCSTTGVVNVVGSVGATIAQQLRVAALGRIEGQRSEATQSSLSKSALSARLAEKISNESGVNIDEEMSLLLRLEHSYQASARIITTVDEMLTTLMNMVR